MRLFRRTQRRKIPRDCQQVVRVSHISCHDPLIELMLLGFAPGTKVRDYAPLFQRFDLTIDAVLDAVIHFQQLIRSCYRIRQDHHEENRRLAGPIVSECRPDLHHVWRKLPRDPGDCVQEFGFAGKSSRRVHALLSRARITPRRCGSILFQLLHVIDHQDLHRPLPRFKL